MQIGNAGRDAVEMQVGNAMGNVVWKCRRKCSRNAVEMQVGNGVEMQVGNAVEMY